MNVIRWTDQDFEKRVQDAIAPNAILHVELEAVVREIIQKVREEGDQALYQFAEEFDHVDLRRHGLAVTEQEINEAIKAVPPAVRKAIATAEKNILLYAKQTLRRDWKCRNYQGGLIGEKFDPFERIGIYVPGGSAPLVSTVLMTALLAKAAGCPQIVLCTPCGSDGRVHPAILYAAKRSAVSEIYRVGGAQAIAAMALGTSSIRPVQKIFGPGNAYVVTAKRLLFGYVSIDLLPGPSELLIIADETADPQLLATDLAAQAEHGSGMERVWLLTTSEKVIESTLGALDQLVAQLPRREQIKMVLGKNGWAILVRDLNQAIELTNKAAPEHCQLICQKAKTLARQIRTAGALFIGSCTPTALGDYIAGPSHTLPTGGSGRSFSGLSADQFQRRTSLVCYNQRALKASLEPLRVLAEVEGLQAHYLSVLARLKPNPMQISKSSCTKDL